MVTARATNQAKGRVGSGARPVAESLRAVASQVGKELRREVRIKPDSDSPAGESAEFPSPLGEVTLRLLYIAGDGPQCQIDTVLLPEREQVADADGRARFLKAACGAAPDYATVRQEGEKFVLRESFPLPYRRNRETGQIEIPAPTVQRVCAAIHRQDSMRETIRTRVTGVLRATRTARPVVPLQQL